jgi:hypothetical protein
MVPIPADPGWVLADEKRAMMNDISSTGKAPVEEIVFCFGARL